LQARGDGVGDLKGVGDAGEGSEPEWTMHRECLSVAVGSTTVSIYEISTSPSYSANSRKSLVLKVASGSSRTKQHAAIQASLTDLAFVPLPSRAMTVCGQHRELASGPSVEYP
ncbi:MAG: hypothetical protein WCE71_15950, partial [Pseudonocardiaceae bacterium]